MLDPPSRATKIKLTIEPTNTNQSIKTNLTGSLYIRVAVKMAVYLLFPAVFKLTIKLGLGLILLLLPTIFGDVAIFNIIIGFYFAEVCLTSIYSTKTSSQ